MWTTWILSTDTAAKDTFIKDLAKDFEFTDQGRLTEMLGIQFGETDEYRTISLGKYIDKLTSDTSMAQWLIVRTRRPLRGSTQARARCHRLRRPC